MKEIYLNRGKIGLDKYKVLLFFVLIFHIVNSLIFIYKDNTPFTEDESNFYLVSLKYYNEFQHPNLYLPVNLVRMGRAHHSIFNFITVLFYPLFKKGPDTALLTNLIFLVILISSVYGIGKKLKDGYCGLLSAMILMFFPAIFGLSRMYLLDFAVTATVSLSIYLLLRSDYFKNPFYSVLFGLSFALGMLTKISYIVFISAPVFYGAFNLFYRQRAEDHLISQYKRNFSNAFALGITIPFIWYLQDLKGFKNLYYSIITFGYVTSPNNNPYTLDTFFFYLRVLNYQVGNFYILAFVFGLLYLVIKRNRAMGFLSLWISIPFIFYTFLPTKDFRFIVPALPAIAIIISLALLNIRKKSLRRVGIFFILLIGLLQYLIFTYNVIPLKNINLFTGSEKSFPMQKYIHPIDKRDWCILDILNTIKNYSQTYEKVRVSILSMNAKYVWSLRSQSYQMEFPFHITSAGYTPLKKISDADYVLVQDGGFIAPEYLGFPENIRRSRRLFEEHIGEFKIIDAFVLPDNIKVSIYKRIR